MGTVARVTEISPTSDQSFEDAINIGISRAAETLRAGQGPRGSRKCAWMWRTAG